MAIVQQTVSGAEAGSAQPGNPNSGGGADSVLPDAAQPDQPVGASDSVPTANQMIGAWEDLRISSSVIEKSGGHHQM